MTATITTQGMKLPEMYEQHRSLVWQISLFWLVFVGIEIGKGFYFNGSQTPFLYFTLFALYLYLPWFLMSCAIGMLAQRSVSHPLFSRSTLIVHLPVALLWSTFHVLILTSAYWVFWPERVSRVTFQFVLGEQAMKWFHFEVIAYFILLHVWRRRLSRSCKQEHVSKPVEGQLSLRTEQGVVRVDINSVECLIADDNYVIVQTGDQQLRVRSTLKEMNRQLHEDKFIQAHRSAIVNVDKVQQIGAQRLMLDSGSRVPVSRRRYQELLAAFNRSQQQHSM